MVTISGEETNIPPYEFVLWDEIKQISTTKKAIWGLEEKKYTFLVSRLLPRYAIKYAIEKFFNVRVIKINTCNLPLKKKRSMGNAGGSKTQLKKAIITLNPNDEITLFTDI
jgi:large subunit ribosomal protein L23